MKLPIKIPLLLLPLIVLPLLVLGWLAYVELKEVSEQREFGEMEAKLNKLAVDLETDIKTARANIELFTRHQLVRKYVLTQDEDQRYKLLYGPLLRVFKSYQESFPDYYEIRIILPDGYEDIRRTTHAINNINDDESDTQYFKNMVDAGDNIHTVIRINPDNGIVTLYVSKPIVITDPSVDPLGRTPTLRGYLVLTIDQHDLISKVMLESVGESGYLFATDSNGAIVMSPGVGDINSESAAIIFNAIMRSADKLLSIKIDNTQSFVRWVHPHPDIYLMASLPAAELRESSKKLAITVLAVILTTIVITTLATFLLMHYQVIRRVQKLGDLASEIGQGNLFVKSGMDYSDEIGLLAKSFEDMASNLQHASEQVHYLAYHDSLTDLPNRALFKEYLILVLSRAKRNNEQCALLFLDIDDFKRINDTLGHQSGDLLLEKFARRLSECLRDSDIIANENMLDDPEKNISRLGGDEFTMILQDIKNPIDAGVIADRLIETMTQPFHIEEHQCYVGVSIGITIYPIDSDNEEGLIKSADIAMYHAKEQGKNNYQYYRESMNDAIHTRLDIENGLRSALKNDELSLFYQPQMSAKTGEITGVEALLRWHHPEKGLVPPDVFIPVAEACGLILPIGDWVINEACRQARAWRDEGLKDIMMSVNVSSIQFSRQNVAAIIEHALLKNQLPPRNFEIEITESTIMSDPDEATRELMDIKSLGVSVALDDFGTGYSSLSYLHRFPIDVIKIDRSFVSHIESSSDDISIISAIIAMAHIMNLRVVAEGIETELQKQLLATKQCDTLQGYLFSKPVPANELKPFIVIAADNKMAG